MSGRDVDRALDLLADRATQQLDAAEREELDRLLADHPELDDESFELAAAAADLALAGPGALAGEPFGQPLGEPLPARVRARVEARADEHFASRPHAGPGAANVVALPARSGWAQRFGWVAAAACLVLAAVAWWPRPAGPPLTPPEPPTAAELRAGLLDDPGVVRAAWQTGKDPAAEGVEGDVVWSDAEQRGYMRFRNLPPNDPSRSQYQLWIFAANQEERYPVDGGVFDVAGAGEVIVPIDAKIRVEDPKLFAVTVEKPGGVVVSRRDRLVLLAKVS
jgi:hypothetical protein